MEKIKDLIERQIERAGNIGNFKKVMEMEILKEMIENQTVGLVEALDLSMKIHANS